MEDSDELLCVAPGDVDALWPYVRHLIKDALTNGNSHLSATNVYQQLRNEQALLWVAADTDIYGVMVTEVGFLGETKVCTVLSLSAKSFKRCRKYFEDIYQYARNEGCERIRLYGRSGWIRALRDDGYTQPFVALEKVL